MGQWAGLSPISWLPSRSKEVQDEGKPIPGVEQGTTCPHLAPRRGRAAAWEWTREPHSASRARSRGAIGGGIWARSSNNSRYHLQQHHRRVLRVLFHTCCPNSHDTLGGRHCYPTLHTEHQAQRGYRTRVRARSSGAEVQTYAFLTPGAGVFLCILKAVARMKTGKSSSGLTIIQASTSQTVMCTQFTPRLSLTCRF